MILFYSFYTPKLQRPNNWDWKHKDMLYIILILETSRFQICGRLNRRGISWHRPAVLCTAKPRRYLYNFDNHIFEIRKSQGLKWYITCLCAFSFNFLAFIIWGELRLRLYMSFAIFIHTFHPWMTSTDENIIQWMVLS